MHGFLRDILLASFLVAVPAYSSPVLVTLPSSLGANDSVNWSQLGADQATIPNSFSATSTGGRAVTGNFGTSTGQVAVVCPAAACSWTTSGTGISAGDSLIWTVNPSANPGNDGPLTLRIPSILGVGAWIQANETDVIGSFTAQIQPFNGSTPLGTFTVTSNSNGDPVFIGVLDSIAEINSVTFSLTAVPADASVADFAMDKMLITAAAAAEPGSFVFLGTGLAGLGYILRRRIACRLSPAAK